MIAVTLQYVLDGNIPNDRQTGVYVFVDSDDQVLYVGQASNIHDRFQSHFGLDHWRGDTVIGRYVAGNMPDALGWTIRLYSLADCRELYPSELLAMASANPPQDSFIIEMAERTLIAKLSPRFNVTHALYLNMHQPHAKPNESGALHLAI